MLDDCAREGLTCYAPASGGVACYEQGQSCSGNGASCDGSTVISCQGGVPARFDCSQSGTFQRCANGSCVESGTQCTVAGDVPSCDGTKVKLCQDGNEVEVDCASLGLAGCQGGLCRKG